MASVAHLAPANSDSQAGQLSLQSVEARALVAEQPPSRQSPLRRRWSLISSSNIASDNMRTWMRRSVNTVNVGDGASLPTSVCLMVQSIMGGGLLTYPHTYSVAGVVNMLSLQAVLLVLIAVGLWVLGSCTERTKTNTYQALVKSLLGRKAEVFCEVALVLLIFGAAVVYLDVFVDQLAPWLQSAEVRCRQQHPLNARSACPLTMLHLGDRNVITMVAVVFLSFLCLGRNMGSLSIPSLLGFGGLLYVCVTIVANYVGGGDAKGFNHHDQIASGPVWVRTGFQHWITTIPVICFSYQGHISAVPLYAELRRRNMSRWFACITASLVACVLLYNVTGLLGYLEFLDQTKGDILQSLGASGYKSHVPSLMIGIAQASMCAAVSVTSAVFTFCARSAILDELQNFRGQPGEQTSYPIFLLVTYIWLILVCIVAINVPDIFDMVSVVGNICAFVMFQFPGLCLIATAHADNGCSNADTRNLQFLLWGHLWQMKDLTDEQRWQVRKGWFFIHFGNFVFVFGMGNALYNLTQK